MYGYARVSTRAQKEDRQLTALTQFGVEEEYIVVEKQSGKDFERPLYKELLENMREHDVLVIKSIDRLGRNYDEILEQWAHLTKELGIAIVVLDMPLLDTREGRDLTGTLVADIVLQLLSYVAQTERDFMRQRQAEGIEAAKARGVRFGRERIPMPTGFEGLAEDWWNGCVSATDAGKQMGISRDTFLRRAREWGADAGYVERSLAPVTHIEAAGQEQIQQVQPEAGNCEAEELLNDSAHSSSEPPGADEIIPQERSCAAAGGVPTGDVKITYVNRSAGKDAPAVFLFTENELPFFDTLKEDMPKRTFERAGCGSCAVLPHNADASWEDGSCPAAYPAAEIGGYGVSADFGKDECAIMAKSVVVRGRKVVIALLPKLDRGLVSEIREGGQFGFTALNSACFYELNLEGLTEVTVGLYGNAKDGYELKIDSKKYALDHGSAIVKRVLEL